MQKIQLNQIQAHSLQPPGRSQDTTELQESHRQIGVLRPPIVVPVGQTGDGDGKYICLAGWRTITARRAMGLKEVLCVIREDLVDDPDKQAAIFMQSNLHKPLMPLERATIIKSMIDDGRDLKHVARAMGVSTTLAAHLYRLATAPSEVQELVKRGGRGQDGLSFSTFRSELASLSNEQMIERLQEAGDLSRKSLKRARQRTNGVSERVLETTDHILQVIQDVRKGLAQTQVFLRSSTQESSAEVQVALRPIRELFEEIADD